MDDGFAAPPADCSRDPCPSVRAMHLSHPGLPVRDAARSQLFYATYFGFDPATVQRYDGSTIIIRNADGFDLALHATGEVGTPQPFLHYGVRLAAAADVRAVLSRVHADGIEIIDQDDDPDLVSFKYTSTRTATGSRCTGSSNAPRLPAGPHVNDRSASAVGRSGGGSGSGCAMRCISGGMESRSLPSAPVLAPVGGPPWKLPSHREPRGFEPWLSACDTAVRG
jgi:catechol 2,3-dioxygenase-like lactoylglutathione lyase family enzyme